MSRRAQYPTARVTTLRHAALASLVAVSLAGCAAPSSGSGDRLGSFMVTPGKYALFACPQLAVQAASIGTRKRDLDALIAKAGTGPGATVAATLAYRTEYAQMNGELAELARESAAKNCPPPPAPKPAAAPAPAKPKKGKPARG